MVHLFSVLISIASINVYINVCAATTTVEARYNTCYLFKTQLFRVKIYTSDLLPFLIHRCNERGRIQ
jgi:hypothetical protein